MISLEHAKRSDRLMRATTSLTVFEFEDLSRRFDVVWSTLRAAKTAAGTARQRQPGGGRKGCLISAQQKLFFILLYYKAYPTQDVMGLLFGITQGQVSEWVRQLTAVVGQLIPLHRPARQARQLSQLLVEQPELREVIIDGTERRLPRPQHRGKQKRFYSGRRKRHAVKNVIIVGRHKVLWCSPTVPARHHDKKVAEQAHLRLPEKVDLLGDSGFEGLQAGAAGVITPWKRRNGRRLHWKRRDFNRLLASERIAVEHTFASVKRLRILRDEFRNRRKGMIDEVMAIGCTLHNYRWETRQRALAA
jgi:DDE superfamily endonuclease/Helix-turn-helix of DDE superfamily endonuclease